jgi:murein L,D-transpeptidase YcbB/YkuD
MNYFTDICLSARIKVYTALILLVLLHLTIQTDASVLIFQKSTSPSSDDTLVKAAIRKILTTKTEMQTFHYPKSVERFYSQSEFQPAWIIPGKDVKKTWEALLLLDCVLQFGLNHADYHPKELLYSDMHDILDSPSKVDPIQKARFDMLLSDALIAFMNHLHFGKLNPVYTKAIVDNGEISGFCADDILKHALVQPEFMKAVLNVQPKVKEYILMQDYMKLIKGQYLDDCYEAPEGMVRKLAINMERLRWANINEDKFIQINIPSYTLKLYTPDTIFQFNVVVGKPATPTPVLQSLITHFATAPDWKVPKNIFIKELLPKALKNPGYLQNNHLAIYDLKGNYVPGIKNNLMTVKENPNAYFMRQSSGCDNALGLVVFRFKNTFGVYLHDTPEQQLFDRKIRAFSHGCIRVQQAKKLASTLLTLDGQQQKITVLHQAMANYQSKNFNLRAPIPLKITYLTCEIGEYGIVEYNDIYNKDQALESALYGAEELKK